MIFESVIGARTPISLLNDAPLIHAAIRVLRLNRVANFVLSRIPFVARTPQRGLSYRMRYLESVMVADEIFRRRVYGPAYGGKPVRTFIDLGANVGYFICDLVDSHADRDVIGLAVDANPDLQEELNWHIQRNGLSNVHAVQGLVGYPPEVESAPLYNAGSNVSSSAQPHFNPLVPLKAKPTMQMVPCVDVLAEWRRVAGDKRVDLLKIDIEGFEVQALQNLAGLLALTDAVVIEWHKWVTSKAKVMALLEDHGLRLDVLVSDTPHAAVGVFRREGRSA